MERRDELRGRLGVERAAAPLEQLRLLVEVRVAVHVQQLALDVDDLPGARLGPVALLPQHLVERVVVLEVVARDGSGEAHELHRRADVLRDLIGVGREDLRESIDPVDLDRPLPRQVVEPDVLELDPLRLDAESRREPALEPDRDVAQPDGPMPSSSSAWVTIPTGFVKSTIQAPGAARRATRSAISRTTGTVRSALAKPPAPVVSWPIVAERRRQGLVDEARRLPADPQLDEHEVGALEGSVRIAGEDELPPPVRAE